MLSMDIVSSNLNRRNAGDAVSELPISFFYNLKYTIFEDFTNFVSRSVNFFPA